jgi:uroporphyrinogen-III synthase
VAVTRDEAADGPLSQALSALGLVPVPCPCTIEGPPDDETAFRAAAAQLDTYDWVVCASTRAVNALTTARQAAPWPRGLRSAAVGHRTAASLLQAGADPAPIVAPESGAEALWAALRDLDTWAGRRVLLPAVTAGRRDLVDGMRRAGADVHLVEAYRMVPRAHDAVRADWLRAAPDAAVFGSPSAVDTLVAAVGPDALRRLRAIVAVGPTTAAAIAAHGMEASVAVRADFRAAARALAAARLAST